MTLMTSFLLVVTILISIACTTSTAADADKKKDPEGINVGAGEQGFVAIIFDGPPLKSDQVKSANHRDYSRGMTCSECHEVRYDFMTTASKQFVNNFPQLTQEEIWAKVVAFLPGRERFALATSMNNEPIATTVDMVLDKDERVLYVVSEIGTEKLLQLRQNQAIGAVRFAGWTVAEGGKQEWRSVQIKGIAEVIPASDPRFDKALIKYNLVRVTLQRAHRRFDLIRVTPNQIYYFDTTLAEDKKSVYQLWKRSPPPG
ncbi:MAG: pyridoxamine 5'-phosphate oxidase family protein [Betaproteobacteria bacterium]